MIKVRNEVFDKVLPKKDPIVITNNDKMDDKNKLYGTVILYVNHEEYVLSANDLHAAIDNAMNIGGGSRVRRSYYNEEF